MKKFFYFLFVFIAVVYFCRADKLHLEPFEVPYLLVPEVSNFPSWENSVWNRAVSINEFYKVYPKSKSAYPISVKLLFSGKNLFIKADLKGERKSGMPAGDAEPAKNEFIWQDSCLNFFIDPKKSNKDAYYHFLNSKGIYFQFGRDISKGWKGDWSVKTKANQNKGEWQALIRCNLEALNGIKPKSGSVWGINFNRHVGGINDKLLETSGWPLNHYKPSSKYAMLIFGPQSKEKFKVSSSSLINNGENNFDLKFEISGKDIQHDDINAHINITSRNTIAKTVFSGTAVFNEDGICDIPFTWQRNKDGQHLFEVILRDNKGLVAEISNYTFHLSSPSTALNSEKPLIWPEPRIWQSTKGYWVMPSKIQL